MRRVILAIVGTVVGLVMLLSFKTHAAIPISAAVAAPPAASSHPTGSSSATATPVTRTVTGSSADTRWGPVQVKITVTDGTITAAAAVVYPQSNSRDQEINSYAVPTLNQESISANSAKIDMVSGATYTSDGYITSLQSALNKAKA